jgi:hypothetical protein
MSWARLWSPLRPTVAQPQEQPAVLGDPLDRLRGIGPERGDRRGHRLLGERSARGPIAGPAQGSGQSEHGVESVRMRRTQHAAAPVDPLGQDFAGPRVLLHRDKHAAEIRHRPQRQHVLRAQDAALDVQQLLEGGPGRGVVAQSAMSQAQVMEGAEGGRIVRPEGIAPAVVYALIHGPGRMRLIHVGQGDGQAVHGREGIEVAGPEDALATLHQDGVGVARDEVLLQLDGDGGETGLDLDRRRVIRPEQLASSLQHLPADRPLGPGIFNSLEQDAEVL